MTRVEKKQGGEEYKDFLRRLMASVCSFLFLLTSSPQNICS